MKSVIDVALWAALLSWLVLVPLKPSWAPADGCNLTLDSLNTCDQADTFACPTDAAECLPDSTKHGTDYSGESDKEKKANTGGDDQDDGRDKFNCTRPVDCDEVEHDGQICTGEDDGGAGTCEDGETTDECITYEKNEASWTEEWYDKTKACDSE